MANKLILWFISKEGGSVDGAKNTLTVSLAEG